MRRSAWRIPEPERREVLFQHRKVYSIYDNANIYEFLKRKSGKQITEADKKKLIQQGIKQGSIQGFKAGSSKGFREGVVEASKKAFTKLSFDQDKYPGHKDIYVATQKELADILLQMPLLKGQLYTTKAGKPRDPSSRTSYIMNLSRSRAGRQKGESIEHDLIHPNLNTPIGITITESISKDYLKELAKNVGYDFDQNIRDTIKASKDQYETLTTEVENFLGKQKYTSLEDIFNNPPVEIESILEPTTPPVGPSLPTYSYPSPEIKQQFSPQSIRVMNTMSERNLTRRKRAIMEGVRKSIGLSTQAPEIEMASRRGKTRSQTARMEEDRRKKEAGQKKKRK